MSPSPAPTPPLSPVLLAGLALRPLPPALLRPIAALAVSAFRHRHPEVFARLDAPADATFLIEPVDVPFGVVLSPGGPSPGVWVIRAGDDAGRPDATIRGPLLALIDLLEGRLDGDAAFFARDLDIEGDTAAVVALRNAIDSAEIDLVEDVLSFAGPLGAPARWALAAAAKVFARAASDLEALRNAALAPIARRCDRHAAGLRELEEQVDGLRRATRRANRARHRRPEPRPATRARR